MPVAIPLIMGASSIGGGLISGMFGKSAADEQAQAALQAAQLQAQEQDKALAFNQNVFDTQQKELAPFLSSGTQALGTLSDMLKPGGQLSQSFNTPFNAPTSVTEQNDPGYQFRLQQGEQALQRSAAAQGGALTAGTAKSLNDYAQNSASNEYQNVYNRALQQYQQQYNIFQQNQSNLYNRYAGLAGIGQTAAGQLSSAGQNAAANNTNALLTGGAQQAQDIQNAAYQTGSGYAALGNALGGGVSNLGSLLMINRLMNPAAAAGAPPSYGSTGAFTDATAANPDAAMAGSY